MIPPATASIMPVSMISSTTLLLYYSVFTCFFSFLFAHSYFIIGLMKVKVKGKAIPVTGRGGP
jgi:hypothetical protein